MRAFVVDHSRPLRLKLADRPEPTPLPNQATVSVRAVSLNRNEVRRSFDSVPDGVVPGWDFSGVVVTAATDGSGPAAGTRVVGIARSSGSWAETIVSATKFLAPLPDGVTFEQAATLPMAGLMALHVLYKCGSLLGKSVLVASASVGVGDFVLQLARLSGAITTAHIRRPEQEKFVRDAGADFVAIGENPKECATPFGPFDLVVESVGGQVLDNGRTLLAERGVYVEFGNGDDDLVTCYAPDVYFIGGDSSDGLYLFEEFKRHESATLGLTRLARLIDTGKLTPRISVAENWIRLPEIAADLRDRKFSGKAVLTVAD